MDEQTGHKLPTFDGVAQRLQAAVRETAGIGDA